MCPSKDSNSLLGHVWKPKKALYGLQQAHALWYAELQNYSLGLDFKIVDSSECVYCYISTTGQWINLLVGVHVDDLYFMSSNYKLKIGLVRPLQESSR